MSNINERIKEIRLEANVTQSTFAKELHLSREYISKIENGKYEPSSAIIALISYKYGINNCWIETGLGEKYRKKSSIDMYKYVINHDVLSEWLETSNVQEHSDFYTILDAMVQLLKYKDIQENSHLFYNDKIKAIIHTLLSYIKISSMSELDDAVKNDWLKDTGEKITGLLDDAKTALIECNLDDEFNL